MIGLLKTMALELPWLCCRHIDLEPEAGVTHAVRDCVLPELALEKGELEVAYRRGQRLIPRLKKMDMRQPERRESPIQAGGVYLIAGGLGGIGTHLATLLMAEFAVKLIVVGRTTLPDREQWPEHLSGNTHLNTRLQHYLALEASLGQGATRGEFVYEVADVCDLVTLRCIVAEAEWRWQAPLAGIIHLAGEEHLARHWVDMEQRGVAVEIPQTFEDILRAKVYGTWILYQIIKERPQASLISFSSVHSLFGAATFGAYAAANNFLDTFTAYQRHRGHPSSYGFNWSMWDDIGMSHSSPEYARAATRNMGYAIISKEQGWRAFIAGLWRDQPQLIVGLDGSNRHIRRHLEAADVQAQRLCTYMSSDASGSAPHLPAIELRDDFGTPRRLSEKASVE
jgi:NAD(P)-dependent dehydrogenase (short-subunit alcohol dehydrogenase family)